METYLEEIIFEEIPHWFSVINGPKRIEVHVENKKP